MEPMTSKTYSENAQNPPEKRNTPCVLVFFFFKILFSSLLKTAQDGENELLIEPRSILIKFRPR